MEILEIHIVIYTYNIILKITTYITLDELSTWTIDLCIELI